MELSKSDKKKVRQLIEIGLQKEYANALRTCGEVIKKWEAGQADNRIAYGSLYETLHKHDKHIAARYDRMTGSQYFFVLFAQLTDGLILESDLTELSPELRHGLILIRKPK